MLVAFGAGATYTYTCPAGHLAILRDVSVYNGGAAGATATLDIGNVRFWAASLPAAGSNTHQEMYMVLYTGEVAHLITTGSLVEGLVCGYEFQATTLRAPSSGELPPAPSTGA